MIVDFRPHEVVWTAEKSARVWGYFASSEAHQGQYFSYHSGESILDFVAKRVKLVGRVLDYGCGPGYLIGRLLNRGVACEGLEFSRESVDTLIAQFGAHPLFRGGIFADKLPSSISDNGVDVVFLVEVIEHLLDSDLSSTLNEIRRMLRPGGHLIVTTPNHENLYASNVICPECGCIFHQWQHVRAFTPSQLQSLMSDHGFEVVICQPTTFGPKPKLHRLRQMYRRLRGATGFPQPHLAYVGRARKP